MNATHSQIQEVVLKAIRNANQARPPESQLECSPDAPLYGRRSPLDSLGLVGLLIDVEDELRSIGIEVTLSDERAMSLARSPFRSVATLVEYIRQLGEPESCQS